MRILKSPQIRFDEERFAFSFDGEIITATLGEESNTFDFSAFPDGEVNWSMIETNLPYNPIIKASRVNGTLSVEIINFIAEDAPEEDKFPEWIEV